MSGVTVGSITQVALPTRDLEAAKKFYRDVLGLPLLFETGGMAFFNAGTVRLMLGPPSDPEMVNSGGIVYFHPDDLAGTVRELTASGVTFLGSPQVVQRTEATELRLHFFKDQDENILALMGEIARD